MEIAVLASISPAVVAYILAFAALGVVVGLIFSRRRTWLILISLFASTAIYVALCFSEGVFSFRFALREFALKFFFDQFTFFLFFCLLPTIVVAVLVSSWRIKRWPRRSSSI